MQPDVIIVGAGLAGLSCARELSREGRQVLVLESSACVGGRVATEEVDGFRIDRGFQVYNDAYPEGHRQFDHHALSCGYFEPGALLSQQGRLRSLCDPWRQPFAALRSVCDGSIGLLDGLRTARLRSEAIHLFRSGALDPDVVTQEFEKSTMDELVERGFTESFIQTFFIPFFGGVFLERRLETASPVFLFNFAMFALGRACLPRGGMSALPHQIVNHLPQDTVKFNSCVSKAGPGWVRLHSGEEKKARCVVIATGGVAAGHLLPPPFGNTMAMRQDKSTRLIAFAAQQSPLNRPVLLVSAEKEGVIDNLSVPSDVVAGYAPQGQTLITISIRHDCDLHEQDLVERVREEACVWFGPQPLSWRHLTTVDVRHALPDESPAARLKRPESPKLVDGLFVCGDHCRSASINGALKSGRLCAQQILAGD